MKPEEKNAVIDELKRLYNEYLTWLEKRGFKHPKVPNPSKEPLAFFLGNLINERMKTETVWAYPKNLKEELKENRKDWTVSDILAFYEERENSEAIEGLINPKKFRSWIIEGCKKITNEYTGDITNIWSEIEDPKSIYYRLRDFKGYGQKKASLTVRFLYDFGVISPQDKKGMDIAVDSNAKKVLARLTNIPHNADYCEFIMAARTLNPDFPAELDYGLWFVGKYYCDLDNPDCKGENVKLDGISTEIHGLGPCPLSEF